MKNALLILFISFLITTGAIAQIKVEKLPEPVNTIYNEVSCVISKKGNRLYFTRNSHPQNLNTGRSNSRFNRYPPEIRDTMAQIIYGDKYANLTDLHNLDKVNFSYTYSSVNQDIWVAELKSKSKFVVWHPGSPINTANNNSVCSTYGKDGLLLFGEYEKNFSRTIGYSSTRELANKKFTKPTNLKINKYYTGQIKALSTGTGTKKNAFISGNVMVFSELMDFNFGEEDIYVCFYNKTKKQWSEPMNVGTNINSYETENRPVLSSDHKTMFFSSEREGRFNIYVSHRLDDTWLRWSKPEKLPAPINSAYNDGYLYLDNEDEYAYFCSDRGGNYDIYRFVVPEKYLENELETKVVAQLFDRLSGTSVEGDVKIKFGTDSIFHSNKKEVDVKVGKASKVTFQVSKDGYYPLDTLVVMSKDKKKISLKLTKIKKGEKIVLHNINFKTGKAEIEYVSKPELIRLLRIMQSNPSLRIRVEGHTNNIGNAEGLRKLSEERAQMICDFLIGHGISSERLEAKGFGGAQPRYNNDVAETRRKNRRVEMVILGND